MKYFAWYGCYLQIEYDLIEVADNENLSDIEKDYYELAYGLAEEWEYEIAMNLQGKEDIYLAIDEACDWGIEPYNPLEHDGRLE